MRFILTTFISLVTIICFGQFDKMLDESIKMAQEESLYRDEVDWVKFKIELRKKYPKIEDSETLGKALTDLINEMRDHHARFFYENQTIAHFTDHENSRSSDHRQTDQDVWREVNYNSNHQFELLDHHIGYIRIVGIPPNVDIASFSQILRSKADSIAALGAEKWIVDLRYNGGGNMYPMFGCLGPILGDGKVGQDIVSEGQPGPKWSIIDGNFNYGEYQPTTLPQSPRIKSDSPVAVLLSQYTVSSGEIVAVAFKGRPNTQFFGEQTGGYTTGNNFRQVSNGLMMNISVSYYSDRDGQIYKQSVDPDEEIDFAIEHDKQKDRGIQKAMLWLKKI